MDYVAAYCARYTPEQIEEFVFTKPLAAVTPEDPQGALIENSSYLINFASAIRLLNLPRGARVLDVACGGGWFSHWLRKIGYDARGLDISEDFVRLARKRLQTDPLLRLDPDELENIYSVHDLETTPLPPEIQGTCDAVVLESCLHHFFDPITALEHARAALKPSGVVLILEGENRQGPLRAEYLRVMEETATLERPYSREQLLEILAQVGLRHVEFLGLAPGFVAQSSPIAGHMTEFLADIMWGSNVCVCALEPEALIRIVPSYSPGTAGGPDQGQAEPAANGPAEDGAAQDPESPGAPDPPMVSPDAVERPRRFRSPVHPRAALLAGWRAFWGLP
jgi:SAM-dependent methyltransferase